MQRNYTLEQLTRNYWMTQRIHVPSNATRDCNFSSRDTTKNTQQQ